ncbi:hypothetical protein AB1Y20_015457 [Prymnesium parvum]|uniref:Glycoside hydrolase family 31 protein n=1 Tax=Prymnesium parvum TaxID=97485 RepID=A0AB34JXT5_PRYPA
MMAVSLTLVPLLGAIGVTLSEGLEEAYVIHVIPWCDNSLRIKVAPRSLPPSVAASQQALASKLRDESLDELPGALIKTECAIGEQVTLGASGYDHGNLRIRQEGPGFQLSAIDSGKIYFTAAPTLTLPSPTAAYLNASLVVRPGDPSERIYGLGQGNWTKDGGCPVGHQYIVPLERNGQVIDLRQRKFHVSIPYAYSTAGYGLLYHQFGYGQVKVGAFGVGGMNWSSDAVLGLDLWVGGLPATEAVPGASASSIYSQYASATGHAPALREDAMRFWQSRNRYKSSAIALSVATRYQTLQLPVGVLVIDYKNQVHDGDFAPDPKCYPSVKNLSDGVRRLINATTVFSFWPEALSGSAEYSRLLREGCLINSDLGGRAIDPTPKACRDLIWDEFLFPRYYSQGVPAYWLDETDGEGTAGGDGEHGYDTSFGPAAFGSNLWVNQWIRTFSEPVAKLGELPLVLVRGVWAGGQRHGVVLWSSDIWSSFEELAAQVPQGVHASLSGIPYWTTDVGGYGCGFSQPNDSPYMQELIVRWYQFGLFCPVFRTHGCRNAASEPDVGDCKPAQGSCGYNEVWSYGNQTQVLLEKYVRIRATMVPYLKELSANVTARGVPTMRPLWWEFPSDGSTIGISDQYMLGPKLLIAPVTVQGATRRKVYFPAGAQWLNFWNTSSPPLEGGITRIVDAPLEIIPAYYRV